MNIHAFTPREAMGPAFTPEPISVTILSSFPATDSELP
jgi:hypothetical protein